MIDNRENIDNILNEMEKKYAEYFNAEDVRSVLRDFARRIKTSWNGFILDIEKIVDNTDSDSVSSMRSSLDEIGDIVALQKKLKPQKEEEATDGE